MTESHGFNPHGTTILGVRRNGSVALGGDGQVTLGNTVMKGNARKVRRLSEDRVLAGFAGGTADAFTLFERFEAKLEKHGNLTRAAIELAKDWRSDRYPAAPGGAAAAWRDPEKLFIISGNGDVIEPEHDVGRHRLGRPVRARRGARAARDDRARRPQHRRALAQHRRRHLHLHQPQPHRRRAQGASGRPAKACQH